MRGSLCLYGGVLYVGVYEKTAHVSAYDLDGNPLGPGFSFRDPAFPYTAVNGLAVDEDHRIWVADTPAGTVRAMTIFGACVGGIGGAAGPDAPELELDVAARPGRPVDVVLTEVRGESCLAVASGGRRRHALHVFDLRRGPIASLRPLGDPEGTFRGLRGVAAHERFLYACEAGARQVQVFRDGDFHFRFRLEASTAGTFEPVAAAPVGDGRLVLALGGATSAVVLVDAAGRLLRILAEGGLEEACVFEPSDLALDVAETDRRSRLAVLDRDGDRVQVFNLEGRCYGEFLTMRRSG